LKIRNTVVAIILALTLIPVSSAAHAPNQSYIFLRVYESGIEGRFEITSDDLNKVFNLQLERGLSVEDVRPYHDQIKQFYLERTGFKSEAGVHRVIFGDLGIMSIPMGDYIQVHFTLENTEEVPDFLQIHYDVLFDKDPTHMGLQVVEYNWKAGVHNDEANVTLTFGPGSTEGELDLTQSSVMQGVMAMIKSGMHHIFIGLDHILFLLALLLPAVVYRVKQSPVEDMQSNQLHAVAIPGFLKPYVTKWIPYESFRSSFMYVVKIVTFFTIAHSITLSLAALDLVRLPSAFVESIIALSIALAAVNNIYPLLQHGKEWLIAFAFGLFHGFGFASVLADLGFGGDFLTWSLLGFNVGVEVGQLIIVILIFPVLFLLRRTKLYTPILTYGSVLLILIALSWFFDRSMGTDLPIDDFAEKAYGKVLNLFMSES